jgi:hypothetical protein
MDWVFVGIDGGGGGGVDAGASADRPSFLKKGFLVSDSTAADIAGLGERALAVGGTELVGVISCEAMLGSDPLCGSSWLS